MTGIAILHHYGRRLSGGVTPVNPAGGTFVASLGGSPIGIAVTQICTLNVNGDGTLNVTDVGNSTTLAAQSWAVPTTPGAGASYYVKATLLSGSLSSGDTTTWQQISTTRTWSVQITGTPTTSLSGNVRLDFSPSPSGSPIVATATFNITAQVTYRFYRDFINLSNAGLTVFQGTVSAATGELVPTTVGANHERVYFDALPTSISGNFDVSAVFHLNAGLSNLSGILFYSQGDVAANGNYANGYWADLVGQFNAVRMIKLVGGSGAQIGTSAALGATSGNHTLRVLHDASGQFKIYLDGTLSVNVTGETTFTSGRMGVIFYQNPAATYPLVNFGMNW